MISSQKSQKADLLQLWKLHINALPMCVFLTFHPFFGGLSFLALFTHFAIFKHFLECSLKLLDIEGGHPLKWVDPPIILFFIHPFFGMTICGPMMMRHHNAHMYNNITNKDSMSLYQTTYHDVKTQCIRMQKYSAAMSSLQHYITLY